MVIQQSIRIYNKRGFWKGGGLGVRVFKFKNSRGKANVGFESQSTSRSHPLASKIMPQQPPTKKKKTLGRRMYSVHEIEKQIKRGLHK